MSLHVTYNEHTGAPEVGTGVKFERIRRIRRHGLSLTRGDFGQVQ